jgi:hypothetical protein
MRKIAYLLIAFCFVFSSCATLFTGTKDRVSFKTTPAGAIIYINGVEQCTTPCSVNVKRKLNDNDVEIKLDGYETRIVTLDKEFNTVSILNLGNILAWGIDAVSGALMKYDKRAYDIQLTKGKSVSKIFPDKIEIDTKKKTADIYISNK